MIPPDNMSPRERPSLWNWEALAGLLEVLFLLFMGTYFFSQAGFLQRNGLASIFILLVFLGAVSYFFFRLQKIKQERDLLRKRATQAEERLSKVLRLSQTFVDAVDEREVVEQLLRFTTSSFGATAATFVPLDERRQPLAAINYGEIPGPVMNDWVEYLASPAVRQGCEACDNHGLLMKTCPLLDAPIGTNFAQSKPAGIYCLPLRRGDREFGILNLYFPEDHHLDGDAQVFLQAVLDETSLALEGVRLRRREIRTLSQLQAVSQRDDLATLLSNFLENVRDTLKADFAYLHLTQQEAGQPGEKLVRGKMPGLAQPVIDALVQGILSSAKPVLLGDVAGLPNGLPAEFPAEMSLRATADEKDFEGEIRALLLAPLSSQVGNPLGVIVVGSGRQQGFNQRQLDLLQSLASQVALVVKNSQLMAELEFKSMMSERTRLAREIHDGLAQTLGFLKLQTSQMQNFLHLGDLERLAESIRISHKILEEAYLDARQAIDGLRILPSLKGLSPWLEQTVIEFQENSGIQVSLVDVHDVDGMASEVQAQLIRIVQEALSNIRKHARARQVWVVCRLDGGDLILEVRDDGSGFSPEDVPQSSRYGLQGMRERTELIGAEFQVISRPQEGTTVRVRLPLSIGERPV